MLDSSFIHSKGKLNSILKDFYKIKNDILKDKSHRDICVQISCGFRLQSNKLGTESKLEPLSFLYRARNYSEELKSCSRFSFDKSHFNPHLGLIVITHGFMENYKGFPQRLKNGKEINHQPSWKI